MPSDALDMSEANEPQSKRQKCDGGETPSAFVLGGPMYDEATARKMLRDAEVFPVGGDIEEGEGFDPRDAALDNVYVYMETQEQFTPMSFFAYKEDLKMMRYLLSRGASTIKLDEDSFCPMHAAAMVGCLDMGKLLHANGAKEHVRLATNSGWTPFLYAASNGSVDFVRWLVLHGSLCRDNNSDEVVGDLIHHENQTYVDGSVYETCERLVEWSKDVLQEHSSVIYFLLGTLPPTPDHDRNCILQCLNGHPGIRKLIGTFVGLEVTKAKQLRILRSVVKVLPETMKNGRKDDRYWVGPAR